MDQTAKNQVLSEIAALEQQVENFTNELDTITSTDPLDTAKYNAIKAELDTAQGKLDAKRAELASIEDAGLAAQQELAAVLDSIDIGGETVSLRALVPDEASYQLLYIWLQQREVAKAQVVAALKSSYESQIEELEDQRKFWNDVNAANHKLQDALADLEAKRDAAANQIQERDDEIARLKADNDNLRKQMEDGAKPKETTADAAKALEAWKASRPAITNLRWKDENRKTTYVATLASSGEEIEFGYLEKNRYREVSAEEADSFRTEPEPVQTDRVPDMALEASAVTAPDLQFPEALPVDVQTEPVPGELVLSAEEITRRLLSLEARVDQIVGIGVVA